MRAIKRFSETKSKLSLLRFDELNVIRLVKTLYEQLEADNLEVFLDLARMAYAQSRKQTILSRRAARAKRDAEEAQKWEELTELWLLDFLDRPNQVTKYIYTHEAERKREYTTEAVNAAQDKATELDKCLVRWSKFTAQYCDLVADEAALQAFKDVGVKRVRWNTEQDSRVCYICEPLDGKVFDIDKALPKQHWNCRCYYTTVG